jgi:glycosyltransferase involved in cell wall biosynthesis
MTKVSVVLPVYNVASYIEDTINSLLNQTFTDFELLIIDDVSTDDTAARVRSFTDSRIHLIVNSSNLGRAGSDNAALAHVRGKYIAKMDGDDRCHPTRLARQVAYLDRHREVNVVGSWMQNFGDNTYLNQYPATSAEARAFTLFGLPVGNPSVMLRAELLRQGGMYYNEKLRQTEDYDFFARYLERLVVVTLPEPLLEYRTFPSHQKVVLKERDLVADQVRAQLLQHWGIPFTVRELHIHNVISILGRPLNNITFMEIEKWLLKLSVFNLSNTWFDQDALMKVLAQRWFETCYSHSLPKLGSLRAFYSSMLAKLASVPLSKQAKFLAYGVRSF